MDEYERVWRENKTERPDIVTETSMSVENRMKIVTSVTGQFYFRNGFFDDPVSPGRIDIA